MPLILGTGLLPFLGRPLQIGHQRHIFAVIESLLIFFKLFFSFILYTQSQFPPPSSLPAPSSHLSPLTFSSIQKGEPSHEHHQQSMAHPTEAGPSSSLFIKAGQGNPVRGIGSQNANSCARDRSCLHC